MERRAHPPGSHGPVSDRPDARAFGGPPEAARGQADAGEEAEVQRAKAGDTAAFERLVLRYQNDVVTAACYQLGNYEDAVDVAQETFLKAYRGLEAFRGASAFRTWLLTITTNCARSHRSRQRAKKRSAPVVRISDRPAGDGDDREGDWDIPEREPSRRPDSLLERKELKEALELAIVELDDASRQVLVLRDISGESYEAIAASLDLPVGTVKSRVHRARLELQARMRPWLEE